MMIDAGKCLLLLAGKLVTLKGGMRMGFQKLPVFSVDDSPADDDSYSFP